MTDEFDLLAKRIRENPDRAIPFSDLASDLAVPELKIARDIKDLVKNDGFFELGNHRVMFSGNSDLVAFEIFKTAATHISFDEYIQYQDQPHLLMRLSRDREMAYKSNPEKMLQDAITEKSAKGESR